MFVAASTECFPNLGLEETLGRLVDLEYTAVEIALHEQGMQFKPSEVAADFDRAVTLCRDTHRLTIAAYSFDMDSESPNYYPCFTACCRLAKASKVVAMAVPAAELGSPFNAEVERLQQLVSIASREGVLVGVKTESGRITQDPATAVVLCDHVKGLGLTLDPSHYVYGPQGGVNYDQVMKHVVHVHLRDTTKDQLQVRVGQGVIEYGKLITQLAKVNYNRALSVHFAPMPDVDHSAEMRKMRLLLESLL